MSGSLGAESTLADLDAALVELVEAGELAIVRDADGTIRFAPGDRQALDLALCRAVECPHCGAGWFERVRAVGQGVEGRVVSALESMRQSVGRGVESKGFTGPSGGPNASG